MCDFPEFLYKYRLWDKPGGYYRKIIEQREIYFASPKKFNDPFDCTIPIRFDNAQKKDWIRLFNKHSKYYYPALNRSERRKNRQTITKINRARSGDTEFVQQVNSFQREYIQRSIGVCSLSISNDNLIMWSIYADSHRGFCVEFNTERLSTFAKRTYSTLNLHTELRAVAYSSEYPYINPFDKKYNNNTGLALLESLYIKSELWQHEGEYRLVLINRTNQKANLDAGVITRIFLGCKMPEGAPSI